MKPIALIAVAVLGTIVFMFALALIVGCASSPSPKVIDCGARYGACVSSSSDVEAYRACRARVDAACLADGGAL